MLAIIMAGGEGERLRPLTCTLPKPMALILDKPILHYTLTLLKKHGVTDAAVTLGYLPEKIIDEFSDGEAYGMRLHYYTEKKPLGTAGGVKQAEKFLSETFCVLSGDGLTDIDLTEALRFHKNHRAMATIVLTSVENPTEYGLVNTDAEGRVTSFLEKPSWQSVDTDCANTGIYILEKEVLDFIPENEPFDFGKQLFPLLVQKNLPVYGWLSDGYWCDIGDIGAYLKANSDALYGKVSTVIPPKSGIIRMPGAIVDDRAVIEGPALIGAYCRIDQGAYIGSGSVVSAYAHVGENASVKKSILYPGSRLGKGAQARGAVLAPGCVLHENTSVFEESVIGEKTEIGALCAIKPGAKIWPDKRVPEGTKVTSNIVWGHAPASVFSENSIIMRTPAAAVSIAQALAGKTGVKHVLVGRDASTVSQSQERAFTSGLAAQGVQVYLAGECTLPLLRHALSVTSLDGAYYIQALTVTPVTGTLIPFSRQEKRAIEAALARQDAPPPYTGLTRRTESLGRFDLTYFSFLNSAAVGAVRRLKTAVFAQSEPLMYMTDRVLSKAGFPVRVEWEEDMMELDESETGVYLSSNGEKACFADSDGILNPSENELLMAYALIKSGERVLYMPPGATRLVNTLCETSDTTVRYYEDEYEWAKALRNASFHQFSMRFDALYASVNILSRLCEEGLNLSNFKKRIPKVVRIEKEIPLPNELRASAFRQFLSAPPEGYKRDKGFFKTENGCAWVSAGETRPFVTVTSEAATAEFASEIIENMEKLILEAQRK